MKKIIASVPLLALTFPLIGLAQDIGGITPVTPLPKNTDIYKILQTLGNWATGVLVALAVLVIIYAAFLYLFAGADEENTEKAKKSIKWAAISIAVALLAQAVVFIAGSLVGKTLP